VHQASACPLTVERAALDKNGVGVMSAGGTLLVDHSAITGGQTGLLLNMTNSTDPLSATVNANLVTGAAETGVQILQAASSSTLSMTGNTITGNCATQAHEVTILGKLHRPGGILVLGNAPKMTFTGNTVSGNGWDQVLVNVGLGSLNLAGGLARTDCGSLATNQFCPDRDASTGTLRGVGASSTAGVTVDARFNSWSSDTAAPAQGTDFVGVNAGDTTNEYCARLLPCPTVLAICPPP
jgi:hypothetical protein